MKKDLRPLYKAWVVAVSGPPQSGKSVFLAELYRQLLARRPKNFAFLQRMCPDGEGVWSAESDPVVVKEIRRKGKFAAGFLERHLPLMVGPALMGSFKIILADLGGIRSTENAEILAHSTHLILLCSDKHAGEMQPWLDFATAEGCQILAAFDSRMVKFEDEELDLSARSSVDLSAEPVQGEMLNLDRKIQQLHESITFRQAVSQFAEWLIAKVESR